MRPISGSAASPSATSAAGTGPSGQCFARLYIGLYLEASDDQAAGRAQIEIAAEPRGARVGGYMHDVARVHLMRP